MNAIFESSVIFAHVGHGPSSGFMHGFMHPIGGLDHVLAMVAVGVWAAMLGGRARWIVPATFVVLMAVGGVIGMAGISLPMIEPGIGASVMVLGLLIALAARAPLAIASAVVGFFAVFHGFAHGSEMPISASFAGYALGFLASTAILHGLGIGGGLLLESRTPRLVLRTTGAAVACVGALLIAGVL